jgi:hypothetical protein
MVARYQQVLQDFLRASMEYGGTTYLRCSRGELCEFEFGIERPPIDEVEDTGEDLEGGEEESALQATPRIVPIQVL